MHDLLIRARQTPKHALPGKAIRYLGRPLAKRARRWSIEHARGELSDSVLLRAFGGQFKTTQDVLDHFRERTTPHFFVTPAEARRRAQAVARAQPGLAGRTQRAAEAALEHVVDLLGSGPVKLGPEIPWHTDYKVGYEWPLDFYEDIDYLVLDQPCDVKMPWELSRCYHWVTLGRAYSLTRDHAYARELVAQLESWLDANPWPYGINWGRAMEVAVRAVNWLWAMELFKDAPELHDEARLRLIKALVQHARHIYANLEFSHNNGNHYLSNGVGLLFLGIMLPEAEEAETWRDKGLEILWGEIERQVHPDGVDFEKGIGYQGLVLEFWYSGARLCELNGLLVPALARERLERMFDFMLAYTRPDGTFPQIGDNDDGRLAGLDDEPVGSHQRHLAVGGVMFDRPDLLAAAGDAVETAVWLYGPEVLTARRRVPRLESQAFPEGGFYVMRGDDAVTVVDAGEVGMNGIGGHGHNDVLSFDLWAAGAPLIVDPGTYVYSADPPVRQMLRSTAGHNSVAVDGEEIARMGSERWLWRIENDALPTVHAWESDADHDLLDAEHSGYARLPNPVVHRRQIRFDKRRRLWIVTDLLEGEGEHDLQWAFHLGAEEVEHQGLAVRLRAPRGDLWIVPLTTPLSLDLAMERGWVSRGYGLREPAPVLRYAGRARLPLSLTIGLALVPARTSLEDARAVLDDAISGGSRAAEPERRETAEDARLSASR